MNCVGFEGWLDGGMPTRSEAAARLHADSCLRCAGIWSAQLRIEQALAGAPATAPPAFAARLLARIAAEPAREVALFSEDPGAEIPLWIRTIADRSTVLAIAVLAMLIGWGRTLTAQVPAWSREAGEAVGRLLRFGNEPVAIATSGTAPGVAALILIGLVSYALYRGGIALTSSRRL